MLKLMPLWDETDCIMVYDLFDMLWIMVYDLFDMLLNSVCQYFISDLWT
jgi:hypothetical protein